MNWHQTQLHWQLHWQLHGSCIGNGIGIRASSRVYICKGILWAHWHWHWHWQQQWHQRRHQRWHWQQALQSGTENKRPHVICNITRMTVYIFASFIFTGVHHIIGARQSGVINIAKVRMAIDWECDVRRSAPLYLRGGGGLSTRNVLHIGLGIGISISIGISIRVMRSS
jgi:hypothetical protein